MNKQVKFANNNTELVNESATHTATIYFKEAIHQETEKAYAMNLVSESRRTGENTIWVPKSVVEFIETDGMVCVAIANWFLKKNPKIVTIAEDTVKEWHGVWSSWRDEESPTSPSEYTEFVFKKFIWG